jgi:predicted RNA binding protein YcfA (HicA-like mRNA interferase family)
LPEGFYKAVCREIKALGFRYDSNAKGSHENWANAAGKRVLIPRNLGSRHTANAILKDAGSEKKF